MKVAILGLGRMGHAVAERLAHSHELVVWNRSPEKAKDLVGPGVSRADRAPEAVRGADVVITSMPDDAAVDDLLFGEGGVGSALPAGSIYVDTSTISPSMSDRIDEALPHYVALPILGAPQAVRSGDAIYLAGGRTEHVEKLGPVLESLGGSVKCYARPAHALAGKLAVNLLLLSGVVTLAESITVGRAGGLDDSQLRDLLGDSPMLAPGLSNRFDAVFAGRGETWWPPPLAAKDAGLAVDVASTTGIALRLGPVIRAAYESATEMGLEDEDMVAVARLYR